MFLCSSNNQLKNAISKLSNKRHAKLSQKKIIKLMYMQNLNKRNTTVSQEDSTF